MSLRTDLSNQPQRARVYWIFSHAFDLEGSEREVFLERECKADAIVRAEVEELLCAAAREQALTGMLLPEEAGREEDLTGRTFGRFRLVERIGEGGMGVVYRAERTDGVPQTVAIKLISRPGGLTGQRRFAREAQLLARLEHPAVARLIDAGVDNERAWIAMEYVPGKRIDEYCAAHNLPTAAIVGLIAQLAGAVAVAHRMLVVHRDIKPTNVLVTADGMPKLIDFGISTALREAGATDTATANAGGLFTPGFAAPEQINGGQVTVATDVYGLGALAYRLLTGAPIYPSAVAPLDYMREIARNDVELASRAALLAGSNASRARSLRGDLDAILAKALERDPAQRYASAADLQADLNRYLSQYPIQARAASPSYRLLKFCKRHAVGVTAVAVLLLTAAVGGTIYGLQEKQLSVARDAAASRDKFLERLLKSADPGEGRRDITVAELLDSAQRTLDQSLGTEPLVEASMLGLIVDTNTNLSRYAQALDASNRQLALLKANRGSDIELARALISRGELLRASGRYAEGVPALRSAVSLLRALHGVDEDRAAALDELGELLTNSGGEREAEALLREAIVIDRRLPVARGVRASMPLGNLAVLLGNLGRYQESAATAREALSIAQQFLPPDHPDVLAHEQTYAMTLLNLHDPSRAEPIQRDIVARSSRIRGPSHIDTLVAQVQLGETLIDLRRYGEAEALLKQAATSIEHVQSSETRYATGAWSDYGIAACSGNDAAEGLAAVERVDVIRARTLPENDWHRPATKGDIGLCLERLHRYTEAEPILLRAAADLEAARGPHFYRTQLTYKALRELYDATGRGAEAARLAANIDK